MNKIPTILLGLISLCGIGGCKAPQTASGTGAGTGQTPITEVYWRLTELHGKAVESVGGQEAHLVLRTEKKRIEGHGGCNDFFGTYEHPRPGRISFVVAYTMNGCPQTMATETFFFKALETADRYEIRGDTLILSRPGTESLARFEAVYVH